MEDEGPKNQKSPKDILEEALAKRKQQLLNPPDVISGDPKAGALENIIRFAANNAATDQFGGMMPAAGSIKAVGRLAPEALQGARALLPEAEQVAGAAARGTWPANVMKAAGRDASLGLKPQMAQNAASEANIRALVDKLAEGSVAPGEQFNQLASKAYQEGQQTAAPAIAQELKPGIQQSIADKAAQATDIQKLQQAAAPTTLEEAQKASAQRLAQRLRDRGLK